MVTGGTGTLMIEIIGIEVEKEAEIDREIEVRTTIESRTEAVVVIEVEIVGI
jgi:hypothetical protein